MLKVRLLLYSLLRDMHGDREITLEIEEGARIQDLFDKALAQSRGLAEAVSIVGKERILVLDSKGRRIDMNAPVEDEQYHIMPPPEGGEPVLKTGILRKGDHIDLNKLVSEAAGTSKSLGAVAIFVGVVREENFSREVRTLIYEDAGKLSEDKLREIAQSIAQKHDLSYVAAFHYTGELKPGDTTMVIVLGGRGRKETFPALSEIVDLIKTNLPIWKKEVYSDGSYSYILGGKPYYPKRRNTTS